MQEHTSRFQRSETPRSRQGQEIRSQHLRIQRTLTGLRRDIDTAIRELDTEAGASGRREATVVAIAEFRGALQRHFAAEEGGGYLREALTRAPRFSRVAADLEREHADLSDRCEHLVRLAAEAGASLGGWQSVARVFVDFAELLSHHEARENEIVSAAYLDDLGGSG